MKIMENQDSVCYIDKINTIEEIPGADKIELAQINGWKSIVPKRKHSVGDIVLVITTDAVIPEEFGVKNGILQYLRTGNRVKTVKLKSVYSDCIILPTNENQIGKDMMNPLNIFKYQELEKIIITSTGKKTRQKENLNFNKYHKFPNAKNVPEMFTEYDDVVITRKYHGTNFRASVVKKVKLSLLEKIKKLFGNEWIEFEYLIGSNNVIQTPDKKEGFYDTNVYCYISEKYNIEAKLWELTKNLGKKSLGSGIIFYGEIYGPSIQGDNYSYGLKEIQVKFFDIELNKQYVNRDTFETLTINLPIAEVLYKGKWSKKVIEKHTITEFIPGTKIPHEGVVVTHLSGNRHKICKHINPDYLIFGEKFKTPEGH